MFWPERHPKKIWHIHEPNLIIRFSSDQRSKIKTNPESFRIIFLNQIIHPSSQASYDVVVVYFMKHLLNICIFWTIFSMVSLV